MSYIQHNIFMNLHKANGTVLGSINGTWNGKRCKMEALSINLSLKSHVRVCLFIFGMFCTINVKAVIYHKIY